MKAGVLRWNIIVDPGIGFAKTPTQSLEIMQRLSECRPDNFPMLLGASRKGFLGKILSRSHDGEKGSVFTSPTLEQRDAATCASTCAGIVKGADIVRVHNVEHAVATVRVADAIWRRNFQYE